MPHFFPPIHYNVPASLSTDPWWLRRARGYFRPTPHSINVWILNDNTVTRTQPNDPSLIKRELLGARNHEVTEAEAALLNGAGFTTTA